jgi:aspartate racemase
MLRFTHGRWRHVGSAAKCQKPATGASSMTDVIFDELVNGIFTDTSRDEYLRIIQGLKVRGCDAVALVCTEIPLLVTPDASSLAILDSTRLVAHAAFQVAVGARPMPSWRGGPLPD